MPAWRDLGRLSLGGVLFLMAVASLAGGQGMPGGARSALPITSPEVLPQMLPQGVAALKQDLDRLNSRLGRAQKELEMAEKDLQNLKVAGAVLKASLAVARPSFSQVEEGVKTFDEWEERVKARSEELSQEVDKLTQDQAALGSSLALLQEQMGLLTAAGVPAASSPELKQAYQSYLALVGDRQRLADQVLSHLKQQGQLLDQEMELLSGLQPQLKNLEEAWKAQLLKQQVQLSLQEQVGRIWKNLAGLSARGRQWFSRLLGFGYLGQLFREQWPQVLGLLGFILVWGWGSRRLSRQAKQRFQAWQARAVDFTLVPLWQTCLILFANLFALGLVLWLALSFWIFGVLSSPAILVILYTLAALVALRLGLQWLGAFFAGGEAGGFLPLDPATARFYRLSLKLSLVYTLLGLLGLEILEVLNFPAVSRQLLAHFHQLGLLIWALWLLRLKPLLRLLPEITGQPALPLKVLGILRGLVLVLLTVIILADLLGFHNLSIYLAQAATWTGLGLLLLGLLALLALTLLHHLFHPEKGWAPRQYPQRLELLKSLDNSARLLVLLFLGSAAVLWSLNSWGLSPDRVAYAFRWVSWGPVLGPLKLNLLNVGAAVLTLMLGLYCARLAVNLLQVGVYPRTGWDLGVQYTISATLRYLVIILVALLALNILGFPLTNLALVAGALGVGIGFGLQNIVNNFISGLILLFERPIKVGDMLVIDGQWGMVREIRVRSTVFETFDRYVLIIPNSELISSKVLNWTHYGRGVNRLTLKVGVSYGTDVRQVTRLIEEVCRANPRVVAEPPPQIFFAAYGESSLDFTVWVHLRAPDDRIPATHELNSAIFETFRQHGIEIPFPQRDLYVKEWPGRREEESGQG